MTEVSAKLSRFKSSASKIRLLADQIRGKKVDEALIMKRIRARARGRADRIEKKSCHINLKLSN